MHRRDQALLAGAGEAHQPDVGDHLELEDDLELDALPPATTVDAVLRLPLGPQLELNLRAENAFDARVVTRNAGGSIDLGTPRTLWIGARLRR